MASQLRFRRQLAQLIWALGLTSCGFTLPFVSSPDQRAKHSEYARVLKTWTRSAKIYQTLDNKLFVSATFHAPELRRAFAGAFPDIYGHGGKITRRELVDLTGGVEQHHNFFLAVYTPDARWNDLAKDDSIWRLTLTGAGDAEVGPDEVVPIKMDENLRAVYPFINRFDKVYLVRFPLVDPLQRALLDEQTDHLTVRIASALGVAQMSWQLHPQSQEPRPHAGPTVP